jgi:N-methylhydantoinase A
VTRRLGIDIGGTFTDLATVDGSGNVTVAKVLTTSGSEERGVLNAIDASGVEIASTDVLVHGTTLVINALLERKGARVALVTTKGFRDVHELGRTSRPQSFNWFYRRDPVLVPRHRRYELPERTLASGEVERTPTPDEVSELAAILRAEEIEAVAVAFLNSYVEPRNETQVAEQLRELLRGVFVTTSSELSRAWREHERFNTAAANAYIGRKVDEYLTTLEDELTADGFDGTFVVMDSNGGALHSRTSRRYPIRLIESGPVGGVLGAARVAEELGLQKVVTFDMGGTTAKSTFIEASRFPLSEMYWVGGYETGFPLQVPTIDVIEVGAGGGSIAWVDDGGRLRVGPRSAGSTPGPACYGRGGTDVTVTDANVYTGRLPAEYFLGTIEISEEPAARRMEALAESLDLPPMRLALGILQLADLAMANLVRQQTLDRGRDPREFALIAFGGAGPLHACSVAAEVGIPNVFIPPAPGVFSAVGMLSADAKFDRREVFTARLDTLEESLLATTLRRIADELRAVVLEQTDSAGAALEFRYALSLRYVGQEHTLAVFGPGGGLDLPPRPVEQFREEFVEEYATRFGHADPDAPIEVAELLVEATRRLPHPPGVSFAAGDPGPRGTGQVHFGGGVDPRPDATPIVSRAELAVDERLTGPALIYENGTMTVVPPGATVTVLAGGVLSIALTGA